LVVSVAQAGLVAL
jgi:hypothetical protein